MTRNVRKYDAEFKRNAVSLYISSGKSYPVLGKELGIPAATLAGWVNSGSYGELLSHIETRVYG